MDQEGVIAALRVRLLDKSAPLPKRFRTLFSLMNVKCRSSVDALLSCEPGLSCGWFYPIITTLAPRVVSLEHIRSGVDRPRGGIAVGDPYTFALVPLCPQLSTTLQRYSATRSHSASAKCRTRPPFRS